jgi:hypothetical protein
VQRGSQAQREVTMAQRANALLLYTCMRFYLGKSKAEREAGNFPVGTPEEVSVAWGSYTEVRKHVSRAVKMESETLVRKKQLGLENGPLSDEEKRKIVLRVEKKLDLPTVKAADEDEMVVGHEAQTLKSNKQVIDKETVELYNEYERIWPQEHGKKFKEQWEAVEDISALYERINEHVHDYNERGKTFTRKLSDWQRANSIISKLWADFIDIFHAPTPMECFDVPSAHRFFEFAVRKPGTRKMLPWRQESLRGSRWRTRRGSKSMERIRRK